MTAMLCVVFDAERQLLVMLDQFDAEKGQKEKNYS